MTRSVHKQLILAGAVLLCIVAAIGVRYGGPILKTGRVIRVPKAGIRIDQVRLAARAVNLAPFATVTVSSLEDVDEEGAQGVADGQVDEREWVPRQQARGAWIRLRWDAPVKVSEIQLYDRPSLADNVLSGFLEFDDGTRIPVDALPPDGSVWRVKFPAKMVQTVSFHIDNAEGRHSGLAEIMVMGGF